MSEYGLFGGGEQPPIDIEAGVRLVAERITGQIYAADTMGATAAREVLEVQHQSLRPPLPADVTIAEVVASNPMAVALAEQMAQHGLQVADYPLALKAGNDLFTYGEVDFQDSLGGDTFRRSGYIHLAFAQHVLERFGRTDPFLLMAGTAMAREAEEYGNGGNAHQALLLRRGLVHMTVFNGTLGEAAFKKFDPYAVLLKQK